MPCHAVKSQKNWRSARNFGQRQRLPAKVSESLSSEAQLAMRLALKDTIAAKTSSVEADLTVSCSTSCDESVEGHGGHYSTGLDVCHDERDHSATTAARYSRLYEMRGSARMSRDLTNAEYSPRKERRRPLQDGAKLESALEIIEFVHYDDELSPDMDYINDEAIAQLARTNAVEKCHVWMEMSATEPMDNDSAT